MTDLTRKNVNYIGRDFPLLRENLITFMKSYFPDSYKDFSEASPGMLLVDLAAYVGDVLNFYLDENFKELYMETAKQRKSVLDLAKMSNYKPKASIASTTLVDVYVQVPASGSAGQKVPDPNYKPIITKSMKITSTTNPTVVFETADAVNFAVSGSFLDDNKMEVVIDKVDGSNIPTHFLLRKKVKVTAAETKTMTQAVGSPQKYLKIQLPSRTVTEIVSVVDSDSNNWYAVDSLAQDTIFLEQQNTPGNDPELSAYSGSVPYLLKLKKVPKRYEVFIDENNLTYLLFGSGTTNSNDEELIPNPTTVGSPAADGDNKYDYAVDPENFLKTKTFGEAPANTTFTITYKDGGGIASNVPSKTITQISNAAFTFPISVSSLIPGSVNNVKSSIAVINENPATGGRSEESMESIKMNSTLARKSQKRCVTKEDYIVRCYSLPAKFGALAKIYVEKDDMAREFESTDLVTGGGIVARPKDPLALNVYVLAYDNNKRLVNADLALKRNLKTYLSQYRIITDTINIVDGDVVNFQVYFKIITTDKSNKQETMLRCIDALQEYFDIDKWSFNRPIIYSEVYQVLNNIDGVQSVPSVKIINIASGNYSSNYVDLQGLTQNGIIYPVRTTSIFEAKFPNIDIVGSSL